MLGRLGEKVVAKTVKTKAQTGAFHKAYKEAPGQTLGTWAKQHKWGVGLTAVSMAPTPFHPAAQVQRRRSNHQGIDSK